MGERQRNAFAVGDDGTLAKERYVSPRFLELEMERLWPRVWQVACREEEIPTPGDYVEYRIGDQSILVVRDSACGVGAFHNTCRHRGMRLGTGCGHFGGEIRCPYHGWRYALDGRLVAAVDRPDFPSFPDDVRLAPVRAETWGGFVFVNMDPSAEPLLDYLDPIPRLLAGHHLERMRLRARRTVVLPANWKAVVDAFNEGYHVQAAHAQTLPWVDDVAIEYEQFAIHARYGRLPGARRALRPSPRLALAPGEYDEAKILRGLVAGLGGAFLGEEKALVEEVIASPRGDRSLLETYQERRRSLLEARGLDVAGLTNDQMTSAEDFLWFPNLVGPVYPGSAILFRVRPNGMDPHSAINDTWVLAWPDETWTLPENEVIADWSTHHWDAITRQDYTNLAGVQIGMRSRGCVELRLNPRQEANVLHMHRVIDRYLAMG
jgi:phenylpropionate dioxygenase-like ring-hydroxylating dioxygenase large terminal subunit